MRTGSLRLATGIDTCTYASMDTHTRAHTFLMRKGYTTAVKVHVQAEEVTSPLDFPC